MPEPRCHLTRVRHAFSALTLFCTALAASATQIVLVGPNFSGSTYGVKLFARPADGNGAIGPAHFVELINDRFAVYAKSDGALVQSSTDLSFWQNAGVSVPAGQAVSNPSIVFDSVEQRWFASAIVFDPATLGLDANGVHLSANMFPAGGAGDALGAALVSIPKADSLQLRPTATNATPFGILNNSSYGAIL